MRISNGVKKIFLIILLGSLLLPLTASAGSYQADGTTVYYQGLIPCGKKVCINGEYDENGICGGDEKEFPCTFCHFFVMLDEIIDFVLFKLVPPIAILMLVIGGAMFMVASFSEWGGPVTLGQAKQLITSVVIGLIIIFASWIFINLFFQVFGVEQWTGLQQGWFQINCPIKLPNP